MKKKKLYQDEEEYKKEEEKKYEEERKKEKMEGRVDGRRRKKKKKKDQEEEEKQKKKSIWSFLDKQIPSDYSLYFCRSRKIQKQGVASFVCVHFSLFILNGFVPLIYYDKIFLFFFFFFLLVVLNLIFYSCKPINKQNNVKGDRSNLKHTSNHLFHKSATELFSLHLTSDSLKKREHQQMIIISINTNRIPRVKESQYIISKQIIKKKIVSF